MTPEIKFCGLTRLEDVMTAVELGATYVGVIFAGGPRAVARDHARSILSAVPATVAKVGVFADQTDHEIRDVVNVLGLDVVQLHGGTERGRARALRELTGARIWTVVRSSNATLPSDTQLRAVLDGAEALMLDALAPPAHRGASAAPIGGTGVVLPWRELLPAVTPWRLERRLVLAGGLRADNVAEAIQVLTPDVVDVSSGIEVAPGIKDHARMEAFREAVRGASATWAPLSGSRA